MPAVEGCESLQTCLIELTLPVKEWITIREAALRQSMTMEAVIADTLRESDYLMTMSSEGK
jgi:hypothetical protein